MNECERSMGSKSIPGARPWSRCARSNEGGFGGPAGWNIWSVRVPSCATAASKIQIQKRTRYKAHRPNMKELIIPYHTSHPRNTLKCLIQLSSLCYGEAHDQDLNLRDHCVCFGFLATCGATSWEGAACICFQRFVTRFDNLIRFILWGKTKTALPRCPMWSLVSDEGFLSCNSVAVAIRCNKSIVRI